MNRIKKVLRKREFLKFFLMFFSGTLLAQIITILISPLLTRIYTPEDFGVYGVYLSMVSLLIVFVTGRYEFAINSTKTEEDAISLFKVINYLTLFISGFIFIIVLLFGNFIIEIFELNINKSILYFIPFTLLLMGFLQGSTYYLNRKKHFQLLTKSKVFQSLANAITSVLAGFMHFGVVGLILANIIGVFVSQLIQRTKGINRNSHKNNLAKLKITMKKYKEYPLYNAPSAFLDTLALQAPIFILLKFYTESIVGLYSLTVRVIGLPLGLISTSISQVFLSQVSELHRNNISYRKVILKVALYLSLIGLIPLIIVLCFGQWLFAVTFGEEWRIAGEYAQILTIGYYFKFIVGPLSMVFFINRRVKLLSIIQTIRAFTTIFVLISTAMFYNIEISLYAYTIHEVIFYIVYFIFIIKTSE